MTRALIATAAAALITLAGLGQAAATTYIVYTSGFDVTSTTGCDYGGSQGSLVTMANGSEGCMVEAGLAASGGDELAQSVLDAELSAAGDDDEDEGPITFFVGRRR